MNDRPIGYLPLKYLSSESLLLSGIKLKLLQVWSLLQENKY
jgi:hypothetical protein